MIASVTCPCCEKACLAPGEMLGKRVRCKACGSRFVAAVQEATKQIVVTCPKCASMSMAPEAVRGRNVRCDHCQSEFVVGDGATVSNAGRQLRSGAQSRDSARIGEAAPAHQPFPPPLIPPPMPSDGDAAFRHPSANRTRDRYRSVPKASAGDIKGKLIDVARCFKRRVSAIKCAWDIRKLNRALEDQLTTLGQLVLQHRPEEVEISADVAELSQAANRRAEKAVTRDTLRNTSGAGSAIKELNKEINELQDREATLMIQIGRKTDAARPEIPGVAAHYAAIDQLRVSHAEKRRELADLQEAAGKMKFPRVGPWKQKVGIAGAGFACLVTLYLLYSLTAVVHVPSYIPDDAMLIMHANVRELADTELYEELEGDIPHVASGIPWAMDQWRDATMVVLRDGSSLVVVHTVEDFALDEAVTDSSLAPKHSKYQGLEYIRTPGGEYLAKLDHNTYCASNNEKTLKRVLSGFVRDESPELDEDMELAFKEISGKADHFLVASRDVLARRSGMRMLPLPDQQDLSDIEAPELRSLATNLFNARAIGTGCTFRSSKLSGEGVLVFPRERFAERCQEDFDEWLDEFEHQIGDLEDDDREEAELALDSLKRLDVRQKGNNVYLSGSWRLDDLMALE